jgi:putative restriction endonuclease
VRAFVGVTDFDWFELLRRSRGIDEVNFWQPGGSRAFTAISPGELFLFKLHSPQNFIVGGGVLAHSTVLPVSLAWESFGDANGAPSFEAMRQRIERYKRIPPAPLEDYKIGCILLTQPFFLSESEWIPIPADWRPNIVQGKRYDLDQEPGSSILARLTPSLFGDRLRSPGGIASADRDMDSERYGSPTLITPRLGQGAFRVMVTDAYERRCVVTGERVLPVLEAAHIRPFNCEGPHMVENGLLLRSDLHTLFDRGYVTVTQRLQLEVSARLRDDFENGRDYYALHGRPLRSPRSPDWRPDRRFLTWHNENVYRG